MTSRRILLINGPNLNLLGTREPSHYGHTCLADIEQQLTQIAQKEQVQLLCFQSNAEHELIKRIHKSLLETVDFILFNPAAFTHTSIALRDALAAVNIPFIEVHLSNIHAREPFRRQSYFSDLACGVISGLGALGYELALYAALKSLKNSTIPS